MKSFFRYQQFPKNGELLLRRLVLQFRRAYRRNDKVHLQPVMHFFNVTKFSKVLFPTYMCIVHFGKRWIVTIFYDFLQGVHVQVGV